MDKPTDLRDAILRQAGMADTANKPEAGRTQTASAGAKPQPGRIGKASVTGYFRPEVRRQLRRLAADADTTIQALLGEALNDLFAKHGLPEIVEPD